MLTAEQILTNIAKHNQGKNLNPFPVGVFPLEYQRIIEHYTDALGCPIDFLCVAILTAISGASGRSVIARQGAYTVIPALWSVIVGSPGINKSAPIELACRPIKERQRVLYEEFKQQQAEAMEGEQVQPLKKVLVSDFTTEALIRILSENERGVLLSMDEIAGFVKNLNRYSAGGDIQTMLSLFNGGSVTRDTVKGGATFVNSTFISIIGSTQPGIFESEFQSKSESGFTDRFLVCYPRNINKPYPSDSPIDDTHYSNYESYLNRLLDLDTINREIVFTDEAKLILMAYQRTIIDRENKTDNEQEQSILSKIEVYLYRFALVLELASYSTGGMFEITEISEQSARGAVSLAKYFFKQVEDLRLKDKAELLQSPWRELYSVLEGLPEPGTFTTAQFVDFATFYDVAERTAKDWLKKHSDASNKSALLTKEKHGVYRLK